MQHTIPIDRLETSLGPQVHGMARAIETCVHCGFCLPTCPTYQVLGEEMDSPRGRVFLMKEVLEGRVALHEVTPYTDRCLGCVCMLKDVQVEKRTLGKTNIEITPIGLGMMEFSGGGGLMGFAFPVIDQEEKNATVKAGLEGGVNWFDTAELYGSGVSEKSLSTALKAAGVKDDDVVIATKWWPLFRTARNIPKTIHDRLRFLDGYSIGLYQIHQPFSFSSPEAEMDAMAGLVKAGLIHSVGVSNFNADQMRRTS